MNRHTKPSPLLKLRHGSPAVLRSVRLFMLGYLRTPWLHATRSSPQRQRLALISQASAVPAAPSGCVAWPHLTARALYQYPHLPEGSPHPRHSGYLQSTEETSRNLPERMNLKRKHGLLPKDTSH